jgi:hypothetical protein
MSIMLSIILNKQVFELHYGFWQMLKTKSQSEDWLFNKISILSIDTTYGLTEQIAVEV